MNQLSYISAAHSVLCTNQLDQVERIIHAGLKTYGPNAGAYAVLSEAYFRVGRYDEAIALQLKALKLRPQDAAQHALLGAKLQSIGQEEAAQMCYAQSYALDQSRSNTIMWLLRLNRWTLNWESEAQEAELIEQLASRGGVVEPLIAMTLCDDPNLQQAMSQKFACSLPNIIPQTDLLPRPADRRKIRIGYVSSDFTCHATLHLFNGVLESHDHDLFEIFLYDLKAYEPSPQRQRAINAADAYIDLTGLTGAETVDRIRADALDIVVDLKGYTKYAKPEIFAARVGQVQVSYLGFPGTLAMETMDYILADPVILPPEAEVNYSEKILRMPQCYQPNDNKRAMPKLCETRKEYGLPQEAVVFASFNHQHKVSPVEFECWMTILRRVPGSVLWFYCGKGDLSPRLAKLAEAHGVSADRIIQFKQVPQEQHLARMKLADVCLDCFAYNAHTTASDAVWAGVPMVTLEGKQFAARAAASILTAAGVAELVTKTREAYCDLAVDLGVSPQTRHMIRKHLEANRLTTALFNTEQYTRDFEALLSKAHARQVEGKKPKNLSIDDV